MTWSSQPLLHENLESLAVAPTNAKILYAAGQISGASATMGVFMSNNGGTTWTSKRLSTYPESCGSAVAVDPRNAKVVYVGGRKDYEGVLFKSTNGGASWKDVTKSIGSRILDIGVDPKAANRVFVVANDGIYRSVNGGTSWTRVKQEYNFTVLAFHPTIANKLYVAGYYGVLVSSDGGTNWTDLGTGLAVKHVRALAFNRSTKVLYAGTAGGGVYKIQQ